MLHAKYKLIACDLDDTLAETKQPIEASMAMLLEDLLEHNDFCVITGGTFEQIKRNVIDRLSDNASSNFSRLHAMSTSGSTYHRFDPTQQKWNVIYNHTLTSDERKRIIMIVEHTVREAGLWESNPHGEIIQDRQSQITFSALGQLASPEAKRAWDPLRKKRETLRENISKALPEYEVVINGNTSVDVLQQGVDKGFGIKNLMRYCGFSPHDVLFIGDSLQPGGNDYPVLELGIQTIEVSDWRQTEQHFKELLATTGGHSV